MELDALMTEETCCWEPFSASWSRVAIQVEVLDLDRKVCNARQPGSMAPFNHSGRDAWRKAAAVGAGKWETHTHTHTLAHLPGLITLPAE